MRTSEIVNSRFAPCEAGRDGIDEERCREHADQHEHGGEQGQNREDGSGDAPGFFAFLVRHEVRINGDEGCGKHAFAEQVLQEIGDAQRGA